MIVQLWTELLMARRAHEARQARNVNRGGSAPSAADRAEADRALAEAEASIGADDPDLLAWRALHEGDGNA